jgi:hypothetical protein
MSDAAPSNIEPLQSSAAEAHGIVDRLESFIGNFKFLSAEARAHLGSEFDRLRTHLPKL